MNDELHRITALVADSRLWRMVAGPLTAAPAAWHSSLIGRTCHRWAARFSSQHWSERVRFLAVTIYSAAAIHMAIVQLLPLYARPAIPMRWWGLVIGVAVLFAVFAEAVTAAWPGCAVATLRQRIRSRIGLNNLPRGHDRKSSP